MLKKVRTQTPEMKIDKTADVVSKFIVDFTDALLKKAKVEHVDVESDIYEKDSALYQTVNFTFQILDLNRK